MTYEEYLKIGGGVDTQFKYAMYLQEIEHMPRRDAHIKAMEKYRSKTKSFFDTKWVDYPSDSLYLFNGEVVFQIQQGSGDNLLPEDVEEGYVDYWNTYTTNGDGGMWLERKLISACDYTIRDVIERAKECDLVGDDWRVIENPDVGQALFEEKEKGL